MNFLRLALIIGALPNTIANGQVEDAVPLMADLNFIVNQVNANAAPLSNTALLNATNSFTAVQSGLAATAGSNFPIASQVQNQSFNTLTSVAGTPNAITARVVALAPSSLVSGQIFSFVPAAPNNAGPVTINVGVGGAVPMFKGSLAQLASADLQTSAVALVRYFTAVDAMGTGFSLINPSFNNLSFLPLTGGTLTGGLAVGTISGVLQFPDGTVNAPGLRVGTSSITGLFSVADNTLRVACSGVEVAKFSSTGMSLSSGILTGTSAMLSPITNSLGADVALNNTANYFDGPSVAQGTAGTWFVSGTVSLLNGAVGGDFQCKLWDGATVIASGNCPRDTTTGTSHMSLSGYITAPAGNLRISVKDPTATTGFIKFNITGNSKDSTITAIRIA